MSNQYQPTSYYDWNNRTHGVHLASGNYQYVPYDYYAGDELHIQNVVFRESQYVTYDNTHVRFLNKSDIHVYDTSNLVIHDSGTLSMYTSASSTARKFVVDEFGRVGIGLDHANPVSNRGESPSFDLDVRGQVGVEDYIYHNDDTDTYMLFGSDLSAHYVNTLGEIHDIYPDDQDEINFRVGGIDMLQMQSRDVDHVESGTVPVYAQDHVTFNKYQTDVDFVVRSETNTGAIVVSGDGSEVVINEDGNSDTDFRVESDHEDHMLFVDTSVNRISIGDSEDTPQATLEITNDPSSGAFNVPLLQLNNKDTDKQLLDINADNINADVINVVADNLTTGDVLNVTADSLTTGSLIHMTHTGNNKSGVSLVHFESTGDRGDDSNQTVLLDLNLDTTDGTGARALRIDSEQTTGIVVEIDADEITTGEAIRVDADKLTTGSILHLESNSDRTATRSLFRLNNDNTAATKTTLAHIRNDAIATGIETVLIESTAADTNPLLELRNSNAAHNTPALLNFKRSSTNEQHDMDLGTITFEGTDSGNIDTVYAAISAQSTDKDNTNEAGQLSFMIQATDSPSQLRNVLSLGAQKNTSSTVVSTQAEVVINEDQIDIDFRVESNTTNNAFIVYGDGSEVVVNENGKDDTDFRVEGDTTPNLLLVDTSEDHVKISGAANDDTDLFTVLGNSDSNTIGANLFKVNPVDIVVNESSNNVNFRVESDTNSSALYVDGAGTEVVVNDTGRSDTDFRVESSTSIAFASDDHPTGQLTHSKTHALFVNTATGGVGLGTSSPDATLHVVGDTHIEGDLWIKGETNQIDTLVHVTSAMDITNVGTGPALTVTQNGAQPVAVFYDGNTTGTTQFPALYIENGDDSGPGNVGIGTSNPEFDLEVLKTGRNDGNTNVAITTHSTAPANTSELVLQTSRGTEASPLKPADNQVLGRLRFRGWNEAADGWNTSAQIHAIVNGTPSSGTDQTDMPGELVFSTSEDSSSNPTERLRIMNTGRIGVGNTATNPLNKLQVEHTGSDLDDGIMIVNSASTITDGTLLGGIGFDGKDGNVPSSIKEASAYIGAYATENWGVGDKGAKLVFGVAFNDDNDDTTTNQPMEIGNTGTVMIKNNHNGSTGLVVDNDHTTGNGTRTAVSIDMDISGDDVPGDDRTHTGLKVDVDSSYTGGDNNDEGRLYGARIEATSSGDNDAVYGAYILGQTSGTESGTLTPTSNLYGAYIQADQNRATLNTNQFGVYSICSIDNQGSGSTVGITNSYGVFGKHLNNTSGTAGTTTAANGGYFHVECDEGTITTATGVRARVDRDAGTISTGYLFRGTLEGTIGTKWGIHVEGSNRNAIEGNLQIGGLTTGDEKTYTTLYADATDGIRVPVGTTAQRPANSVFGITAPNPTDTEYLPKVGTIRYNTDQSTFEGFGPGNQWGSLGGVIDVDRDTYWTAINDLNNLHDLGGTKYGDDEFDPDTEYPGDVDYLRAFTQGFKRFAITDTGDSKWYYKSGGAGTTGDPYTYKTMLQVSTATGGSVVSNPTQEKNIIIETASLPSTAASSTSHLQAGDISIISGLANNRTTNGNGNSGGDIYITAGDGGHAKASGHTGGNGGDINITAGNKNNGTSLPAGTTAGEDGVITLQSSAEVIVNNSGLSVTGSSSVDKPGAHLGYSASHAFLELKGPTGSYIDFGPGAPNTGTTTWADNLCRIIQTGNNLTVKSNDGNITLNADKDVIITKHDGTNGLTLGSTLVTASGTELNYVKGVSSGIQGQLNTKAPTADAVFTGTTQVAKLGVGMAPSTTVGEINASADIIAFSSSDERLKENITPISDPIEKLSKIGGYEFDWKDNDVCSHTGHDVGVIAQEIEQVLPDIVTTRDSGYKAVKYEKLTALLIEVTKSQQAQIDELTRKVEQLSKQL